MLSRKIKSCDFLGLLYCCFPSVLQHLAPLLLSAGGLTVHNTQAAPAKAFYATSVRHLKIHWAGGFFDDATQHYTTSADFTPACMWNHWEAREGVLKMLMQRSSMTKTTGRVFFTWRGIFEKGGTEKRQFYALEINYYGWSLLMVRCSQGHLQERLSTPACLKDITQMMLFPGLPHEDGAPHSSSVLPLYTDQHRLCLQLGCGWLGSVWLLKMDVTWMKWWQCTKHCGPLQWIISTWRCNAGECNTRLLCSFTDLPWLLDGSGEADAPGDDELCDYLKREQDSDKTSPALITLLNVKSNNQPLSSQNEINCVSV